MNNFEKQLIDCIPKLKGFIRKILRDEQLIDDILQDTLLSAWRSRGTFKGDSKLITWLCRIAINHSVNYWKKDKSSFYIDGFDTDTLQSNFDMFQSILSGYILKTLDFNVLTVRQRDVLLESLKGTTVGSIANSLGMAEGTVKSQLHRARRRLKREPVFCR